jgi:hypothetical protein
MSLRDIYLASVETVKLASSDAERKSPGMGKSVGLGAAGLGTLGFIGGGMVATDDFNSAAYMGHKPRVSKGWSAGIKSLRKVFGRGGISGLARGAVGGAGIGALISALRKKENAKKDK